MPNFCESPSGAVNAGAAGWETGQRPYLIAVDPGSVGGAIAHGFVDGEPEITKMPNSPGGLWKFFHGLKGVGELLICIEDVGKPRSGSALRSVHTFSKHRGHLEMAVIALGCASKTHWVSPMEWMMDIAPSGTWPHGNGSSQVTARKKFFTSAALNIYPNTRIPQYAGDAACIYAYGQRNHCS